MISSSKKKDSKVSLINLIHSDFYEEKDLFRSEIVCYLCSKFESKFVGLICALMDSKLLTEETIDAIFQFKGQAELLTKSANEGLFYEKINILKRNQQKLIFLSGIRPQQTSNRNSPSILWKFFGKNNIGLHYHPLGTIDVIQYHIFKFL